MIIEDKNHFEVVPKKEYEEMVRIVKERQNIHVQFHIDMSYSLGYGNTYNDQFYVWRNIYELNNDKISEDLVNETANLIESACKKVLKEKQKEVDEIYEELINIRSKWWYKLFSC